MTTALYRRYRPETFADVIGQEHVTEPLMQALRTGRVAHAYLFSGPRGCGKTTSARILARCLNCAEGPTPEPCGQCESCVALARGGPGSVDVIEIDAASHGGVDDARDLRERASYGPAQARYKVYIIDEAHMVTTQGFNALLKIVEEPPEHVKFVFATTEPEKVIGTIRSRTHHYPFRLVPPARLQGYLEQLCEAEGVSVEPGVLSFVVRAGGGSVRDSLSVLDQLIAGSDERGLTYERAAALLGFTDGELLDATIDALAAADGGAVFRQVDRVIESGHDPRRFVEDLLERLRDLIIVAAVPDGAASVLRGVPEDQLERMRQQAAAFGPGALSRAADIVNTGLTEMTGATAPRLQLELICARVLLPGASGESGYAARLDRLERRLAMGGGGTSTDTAVAPPAPSRASASPAAPTTQQPRRSRQPEPGSSPSSRPQPSSPEATPEPGTASVPEVPGMPSADAGATEPAPEPAPETAPPSSGAPDAAAGGQDRAPAPEAEVPVESEQASTARGPGGVDTEAIRRSWPDVLDKIFTIKRVTWTLLSQHAQVLDYDGRRLLLGIGTVGIAETFRRGPHAEIVRQALIEVLGVDTTVEGRPPEPGQPEAPSAPAAAPAAPPPARDGGAGPDAAGGPGDDRGGARPPGGDPGASGLSPSSGWEESERSDWGEVAASTPPPDWATGEGGTDQGRTGQAGAAPPPGEAPHTPSAADQPASTESPRQRAMQAVASEAKRPAPEEASTDDSQVSRDDEDIEDVGAVGQPVIENVLGGTVIGEFDQ